MNTPCFRFNLLVLVTVALTHWRAFSAEIPRANAQQPDGRILLLATNAITHGKTIRYEPQPHKNTIGFWTKADDWVSWDFTVTKPGTFEVTLTQSCGKGSGGSEVEFGIGQQVIRDVVPETGSFTTWTNRTIGRFHLGAVGTYTVTVKARKKPGLAVMDLRALTLTPAR